MKRENLIIQSHRRCRRHQRKSAPISAPAQDRAISNQSQLSFQIISRSILRKTGTSFLPDSLLIAVSDAQGVIKAIVKHSPDCPLTHLFKKNSCWSEERIGTNGLALALLNREIVTVFGDEHLIPELKECFSTGVPFILDGQVLGGILVVGALDIYQEKIISLLNDQWKHIRNELIKDQEARKSAKSMLIEENMRLAAASSTELSPELGVLIIDPDNRVIEVNSAAEQYLRRKPGESLDLEASPFEKAIIRLCAKCLDSNEPCFLELTPDITGFTTTLVINGQPLKNSSDDSTFGTMLIIYDLGQTFLHQSAATLQALSHLDDDVVILDRHGRIVFGNRFHPEDIGEYYLDVVFNGQKYDPSGEHNSLLIQALETGEESINKIYQTPDGSHTRQTHIRLLKDSQGKVTGVVGIRKDITEEHKLKNQLVHSERLSTIGELATQTIHELRNPLAAMRASAQLALVLESEEKDTVLRQIMKEIDKINEFVSNILLLAKPNNARFQPENLADILDSVLELVEAKSVFGAIKIIKNYDRNTLNPVRANAKLLEQAFLNVINNAFDAMKEGGTLTLKIREHPKYSLQEVIVADTGPGIDQNQLNKLFTPFFTTKGDSGTGLGLAITKQIISETHGGRIWVESEVGRGTKVHLELPSVDRSM